MEEELDLDQVIRDSMALCKRCGDMIKKLANHEMDRPHEFLTALMLDNSLYWISKTIELLGNNIIDLQDQLDEYEEEGE